MEHSVTDLIGLLGAGSGPDLSQAWILLLVFAAGLGAGWIDAVVGGGGLIQLPAVLLIPGLTPLQALGTNKLGSIFGTTVSAATYAKRFPPEPKQIVPMGLAALAGALAGAGAARLIPKDAFTPIIIAALTVVLLITILRPSLGQAQLLRFQGRAFIWRALMLSAAIGFYDGVLGPGTGSFLVMGLVGWLGYSFLQASARAKVLNWCTNLGALILFVPTGAVHWGYGLLLACGNIIGARLGARTALGRGSGFVRIVMICVVSALLASLLFKALR